MTTKQNTTQKNASYGHGLLQARGGWTLREMLGAHYERFRSNEKTLFTQKSTQESPSEKLSDSVPKEKSKK